MTLIRASILSVFFLLGCWQAALALEFNDDGEYAGSSDCRECHGKFYKLWSTSHHGTAMQAFSASFARTLVPMEKEIALGEDNFIVELNSAGGVLHRTGKDGSTQTYPILHALGGRNVYFFLVPLEKGKLQVAPLAYNVHTKTWYDSAGSMVRHFSPGFVDAPLKWTDRQLTFNTACHDCHVSQLSKNYDPATGIYTTTWKEAGISCEVCHGPAEEHIRAAREASESGMPLSDPKLISYKKNLNMKQRDASCAPCHAKMMPLSDTFIPGEAFFDHYDLVAYESHDFFPDGRDLGENYTQTSWMANLCAAAGQLECLHCHTSSGRFRFAERPNQSCLPCHKNQVDTIMDHSHHKADAKVSCIDCHMPKTAQSHMTRSDHSFRPPSPAATLEFGSPNACNLCHHDKEAIAGEFEGHEKTDVEWAMKHVAEWFGPEAGKTILEQGRILQACRENEWDKLPEILAYLDSPKADQPSKVGILRLLASYPYPYPEKWPIIRRQLESEHEWVRSAAAAVLRYDDSAETTQALLKAAQDKFRTVRIRAASSLIGRDLGDCSDEQQMAYADALDEYWNSLVIWPDRWSTYYNQGIYFERLGEPDKALSAYAKSRELRNDLIPPLINAAMVHARMGNSTNAYQLLQEALDLEPENPMVNFNIALQEAEFGNLDAAERNLRTALESDPGMASAAYNLGVLLCRAKKEEGFKWLHAAALMVPENWDYTSGYLYFLDRDERMQEIESTLLEIIATGRAASRAYFSLAGSYQREGRTAEAIEICEKAKRSKWLSMDDKRFASEMEQFLFSNKNP